MYMYVLVCIVSVHGVMYACIYNTCLHVSYMYIYMCTCTTSLGGGIITDTYMYIYTRIHVYSMYVCSTSLC